MFPDYKLIHALRTKFLGQGLDSLSRDETLDLINHLHEALSDKNQAINIFRTKLAYEQERNQNNVAIADEKIRSLEERYHELLLAVRTRFPGESLHQTALKYIRGVENGFNSIIR